MVEEIRFLWFITRERWEENEIEYAGRVAVQTDAADRLEHLKKVGMNGGHSVCVNNELIVLNIRHQTAKQRICLAVFIMCGKIVAHFRGKERKGTKKPPPRAGEGVIRWRPHRPPGEESVTNLRSSA